jgi:hypothetical protein
VNAIQKKRAQLERRLTTVQNELAGLRINCPHASVKRTARSDTGNWDRGQDAYWDQCECLDCGKHWTDWK